MSPSIRPSPSSVTSTGGLTYWNRYSGACPPACGDLIDRGPDSRGVIERLLQRGAIGVRGNHEEWFIRWATGQGLDRAALNLKLCGAPTLRSYGVNTLIPAEIEARRDRVPEAHRTWLCGLPVALDLEVCGDRYWVIHAGVPSTVELAGLMIEQVVPHLAALHPTSLTWPSNDPEMMLPVDRPVIMGHVGQKRARDLGHVIALDTGCGRAGGRLSAVILPGRRFLTVGE